MDKIDKKLTSIEKAISAIIKDMATKQDMKSVELKLLDRMEESQMEIIAAVERHKADKESVKVLEKRVVRLEDNAGLPPYADQ